MRKTQPIFAAAWIAATALPGCAGTVASGVPAGPAVFPATAQHVYPGKSRISPSNTPLLYVTDSGSATVKVYTYPGLAYQFELTGFGDPLFDCADRAGNVWIVDYDAGQLIEYAHGGTTPIQTLSGLSLPYECSVNHKNGDLAVAENVESGSVHLGEVAVFHKATGTPTVHSDSNFALIDGATYDGNGNLFVDGYTGSDAFHYAELPAGNSTFTEITLSESPGSPGMVLWDGQYVDIADYSHTIYQAQGSTVVNTISLNLHADTLRGFFVPAPRKHIIATDAYANAVDVFAYPAGGSVQKKIATGLNTPWCVVLSP